MAHFPIVELLVQNGADVNQAENNGITPLLISSDKGYFSIVEFLVENGADINQVAE